MYLSPKMLGLLLCICVLSACARSGFEVESTSDASTPFSDPQERNANRTTSERIVDVREERSFEDDQTETAPLENPAQQSNFENELEKNELTEDLPEVSNAGKKEEQETPELGEIQKPQAPAIKELPKEVKIESKEKVSSNETPKEAVIAETGFTKPTIYFFPIIDEDTRSCAKGSRMISKSGATLINLCASTFETCSLQGSCAIVQNGKTRSFNIIGKFMGVERYFETTKDKCSFGYGVKSSCLDPFYTLAADLSIYKPGDVVYVPSIRGLSLPDGSKHTGYFAIRDQGRGIIGKGRFDFFTGFYSWKNKENPFNKIGLGNVKTNVPYQVISGEYAKKFLKSRAFPSLPANAIDERPE